MRRVPAVQQREERLGGLSPVFVKFKRDRRDGGHHACRIILIVESGDGHLLRHLNAAHLQGAHDADGEIVIGADDRLKCRLPPVKKQRNRLLADFKAPASPA